MELRVGNVTISNYFDLIYVISFCWFIPYVLSILFRFRNSYPRTEEIGR